MKTRMMIALSSLFLGLTVAGCAAHVDNESDEQDVEESDVEESEQGLAYNCVGRCVDWYRACVRQTGDYVGCAAEREACKEECYENTCEPSDPGCCQGQPTCW